VHGYAVGSVSWETGNERAISAIGIHYLPEMNGPVRQIYAVDHDFGVNLWSSERIANRRAAIPVGQNDEWLTCSDGDGGIGTVVTGWGSRNGVEGSSWRLQPYTNGSGKLLHDHPYRQDLDVSGVIYVESDVKISRAVYTNNRSGNSV
jgi:hypothetical protein